MISPCYYLGMTNAKTSEVVLAEREENGQYSHGNDRMCRCGHRKGEHDAHAPFGQCDPFDCAGFKKAKAVKGG